MIWERKSVVMHTHIHTDRDTNVHVNKYKLQIELEINIFRWRNFKYGEIFEMVKFN